MYVTVLNITVVDKVYAVASVSLALDSTGREAISNVEIYVFTNSNRITSCIVASPEPSRNLH